MRKIILYLILSLTVILTNAQTPSAAITLTDSDAKIILKIIEDMMGNSGLVSHLKISNAYISTFIESADYGPMWYGDTIEVNQSGYLVQYEYSEERGNSTWKSSETIFIPNDKSAIYRQYTCRFGGIPPSHGFANRRIKWNNNFENILLILNKHDQ